MVYAFTDDEIKIIDKLIMEKVITIPETYSPDNWINFITQNRKKNSNGNVTTLKVDLSPTDYIYTVQLVSLACLIEEYHKGGVSILFMECSNSDVCTYLSEIKFFNYWDADFNRKTYTVIENTNCLCLWNIHMDMIDSYVNFAKDFAEKQWKQGKDFSSLHISLAELFNNVRDHSKSEVSGYCITQYHPTHQELRISVCDFGIGICNCVKQFLQKKGDVVSNVEALEKAFTLNFTAESQTHNKGFGLNTISDNVTGLNGTLEVYTNDTQLIVNPKDKIASNMTSNIDGTIFDIIIDTNHLDDLEEESFVNFELFR